MRVVVQNTETDLFYLKEGVWVPEWSDARIFSNSVAAVDFCLRTRMRNVQVVLKFSDPAFDFIFPVTAPMAPSSSPPVSQGEEILGSASFPGDWIRFRSS